MGQTIEINQLVPVDDVLIVDTDRTLAGQDGEAFDGLESARAGSSFPARLAVRLFEADPSVDHVFVMSNTVVLRRSGGWDDAASDLAGREVSEFFRFYRP